MLKIAYDLTYLHPLPAGHRFPMLKYELIPAQLLYEGLITDQNLFAPALVNDDVVLLTHDKEYWDRLKNLSLSPLEARRTGFPISASLVNRERQIVQGTIDCCYHAFNYGVSFNIAGGTHHAGSNWGEGFCLLNDQAIAANYLLQKNLASKILIIDLDVHQGNGTAQIFTANNNVFTFSIHAEKNFPFRKESSDWDIGLLNGIQDQQYIQILEEALQQLFLTVKPDFVFYLAGVDVLSTDKLGHLNLSRQGCKDRDQLVFNYCKMYNLPVQVSMGGGYSVKIQDIVDAHCNTFKAAINTYF